MRSNLWVSVATGVSLLFIEWAPSVAWAQQPGPPAPMPPPALEAPAQGVVVRILSDGPASLLQGNHRWCDSPCGVVVPPPGPFSLSLAHAPDIRTGEFQLPMSGSVTLEFQSNNRLRGDGVRTLAPGVVFLSLSPVWALGGLAGILGGAFGGGDSNGGLVAAVIGLVHFAVGLPLTIVGGVLTRASPKVRVVGPQASVSGSGLRLSW